ncbi:MAG: glycosyltransferase [Acidimicrobiia bacterium]|nr:glycosyltransferase [Acidimicrobiia bacterium]
MTTSGADLPWTVVNLAADDSPATRSATSLVTWLAERSDVDLHTVLWLPGWTSTTPFESATFHDVAGDHRARLPQLLRRMGAERPAGILTARAVRSTLATVPRSGVVYLNGAACAVALRYLPAGDRTVVTHLHADDRQADPPLPPERVHQLVDATDVWLAADQTTLEWAAEAWGIDPAQATVVGELVDLASWEARNRPTDPDELALALLGNTWFRSDHAARLVQALLAVRPTLAPEMVWAEVEQQDHLAPLLHDLRTLGVLERLRIPTSHREVAERLAQAQVLALTAPDDEVVWLAQEAVRQGLPVVCFETHRTAREVGRTIEGRVVPYLDVVAMAEAVMELADTARLGHSADREAVRTDLAARDVGAVGPWLLERTAEGSR